MGGDGRKEGGNEENVTDKRRWEETQNKNESETELRRVFVPPPTPRLTPTSTCPRRRPRPRPRPPVTHRSWGEPAGINSAIGRGGQEQRESHQRQRGIAPRWAPNTTTPLSPFPTPPRRHSHSSHSPTPLLANQPPSATTLRTPNRAFLPSHDDSSFLL